MWENNQSRPSTEKLIEISKFFGVSVDSLIDDEVSNNNKIIIRTIHSETTYKTLLLETTNFFVRHFLKILIICLVGLFTVFKGVRQNESLVFIILFIVIFVPISIFVTNIIEKKKVLKTLNYKKSNVQKFFFGKEELMINFEDEVGKVESKKNTVHSKLHFFLIIFYI